MECDEFLVDDAGERQGVEALHDEIVDLLVVLTEDLLAEIKVRSHLTALVVATEHDDSLRVVDFKDVEKHEDLEGEAPTVDVVTEEEESAE